MLQIFTSISDTLWSGYLKKKKKWKQFPQQIGMTSPMHIKKAKKESSEQCDISTMWQHSLKNCSINFHGLAWRLHSAQSRLTKFLNSIVKNHIYCNKQSHVSVLQLGTEPFLAHSCYVLWTRRSAECLGMPMCTIQIHATRRTLIRCARKLKGVHISQNKLFNENYSIRHKFKELTLVLISFSSYIKKEPIFLCNYSCSYSCEMRF